MQAKITILNKQNKSEINGPFGISFGMEGAIMHG